MTRVVIFDSGVGGLSIHAELNRQRPDLVIQFVSDNAAHPYGTKGEQELIARVEQVISNGIEQLAPDLIIIACNTASTLALSHLRERFNTPFIGVVPAIKPAAQISTSKRIALLGTPATVQREYTKNLIEQFASDCEVRLVGSSKLVEFAETKLRGEIIPQAELEAELQPVLKFRGCDTIVLACTHFPLIINDIKNIIKSNNELRIDHYIDSASAIARRVTNLIPDESIASADVSGSWFTSAIDANGQLASTLKSRGLEYRGVLTHD